MIFTALTRSKKPKVMMIWVGVVELGLAPW
jgi:hypothetical protein